MPLFVLSQPPALSPDTLRLSLCPTSAAVNQSHSILLSLQDFFRKKRENVNSAALCMRILARSSLGSLIAECKTIFFSNENILIVPSILLLFGLYVTWKISLVNFFLLMNFTREMKYKFQGYKNSTIHKFWTLITGLQQ